MRIAVGTTTTSPASKRSTLVHSIAPLDHRRRWEAAWHADQAKRRVFAGESVQADEKLVSLFETRADIIVKGGRKVQYGHLDLLLSIHVAVEFGQDEFRGQEADQR